MGIETHHDTLPEISTANPRGLVKIHVITADISAVCYNPQTRDGLLGDERRAHRLLGDLLM